MRPLTPRQKQILEMIQDFMDDSGMPPTRAEIARELGFKSANAAEEHLRALQKKGVLELLPGASRGIQLKDSLRDQMGLPLVGRVAAVNAASDVLAKGGTPRHALALVTVPEEEGGRTEEALYQVLAGVRAALDPLGVTLVGGHTTQGQELFVGLAITGDPPASESILGLDGARPRDALILTKPLGTGVLLAADMQGLLPGPLVTATHTALLRDNAAAARVALACGARACTDVSGFGLAGHLAELLRASGVSGRVDLGALPALDGALAVLSRGVRSTFHDQNAEARRGLALPPAAAASPALPLLFDPQTSGGLLMSVPEERTVEAIICGDVYFP